jgi:hypothetical protein
MNLSPRSLLLIFVACAASLAGDPAANPAATIVVKPVGNSALPAPPPLQLKNTPLANVARIFSARYHIPIRIEANESAPITGDFTHLGPAQAVAEAARQAKLVATPLGPQAWSGYRIGHPPVKPASTSAPPASVAMASSPSPSSPATPVDAADRERAKLLQERARLLDESSRLDH